MILKGLVYVCRSEFCWIWWFNVESSFLVTIPLRKLTALQLLPRKMHTCLWLKGDYRSQVKNPCFSVNRWGFCSSVFPALDVSESSDSDGSLVKADCWAWHVAGRQVWARNTYQSAFLASSLVLGMLLVLGHECDADGDAQWWSGKCE